MQKNDNCEIFLIISVNEFCQFFMYPPQHIFFEIIKKKRNSSTKTFFSCIRNYFLIHEALKIVQHTEHEFHQISLYCNFFLLLCEPTKIFYCHQLFFHSFIHNYIQLQINDLFIFCVVFPDGLYFYFIQL